MLVIICWEFTVKQFTHLSFSTYNLHTFGMFLSQNISFSKTLALHVSDFTDKIFTDFSLLDPYLFSHFEMSSAHTNNFHFTSSPDDHFSLWLEISLCFLMEMGKWEVSAKISSLNIKYFVSPWIQTTLFHFARILLYVLKRRWESFNRSWCCRSSENELGKLGSNAGSWWEVKWSCGGERSDKGYVGTWGYG